MGESFAPLTRSCGYGNQFLPFLRSACFLWYSLPPHNFARQRERKRQTSFAIYVGEGRQAKLDAKDLGGRNN